MTPAPVLSPSDLQAFLVMTIKTFVAQSPLNHLAEIDGSPIWDEPLVGFASGDDPLFVIYKTVVGDFHLLPRQVLGDSAVSASIVSWILPTAKATRRQQPRGDDWAFATLEPYALSRRGLQRQPATPCRGGVTGTRIWSSCSRADRSLQDQQPAEWSGLYLVRAPHCLRCRTWYLQPVGWADHGQRHCPSLWQRRLCCIVSPDAAAVH